MPATITAGSRHATRGDVDGVAAELVLIPRLRNSWIDVYLDDQWVDVTDECIGNVSISSGIHGSGPLDRVAEVGTMRFALDGTTDRWKPRAAGKREGWQSGVGVRLRVLSPRYERHVRWTGYATSILPSAQQRGERLVHVEAVDWMDHGSIRVAPPVAQNVTVDAAATLRGRSDTGERATVRDGVRRWKRHAADCVL